MNDGSELFRNALCKTINTMTRGRRAGGGWSMHQTEVDKCSQCQLPMYENSLTFVMEMSLLERRWDRLIYRSNHALRLPCQFNSSWKYSRLYIKYSQRGAAVAEKESTHLDLLGLMEMVVIGICPV